MIAFRIVVNGKKLITAGLPGHHVVTAIISSVVREPSRAAAQPEDQEFVARELELEVGGLVSDVQQHVLWSRRRLKVGDRIEVEVLETDTVDRPIRSTRRVKRATKRPVRQLKQRNRPKP